MPQSSAGLQGHERKYSLDIGMLSPDRSPVPRLAQSGCAQKGDSALHTRTIAAVSVKTDTVMWPSCKPLPIIEKVQREQMQESLELSST